MTSSVRYALVDKCAPAVERDPVIEQQDIAGFEPKPHVQRRVLGQCLERIEGFPLSRGEARRLRSPVGAVDEHPQEVGTEPPVPLRKHRELAKRQGVALIHRVTQVRKRLAQHSEHVWLLTAQCLVERDRAHHVVLAAAIGGPETAERNDIATIGMKAQPGAGRGAPVARIVGRIAVVSDMEQPLPGRTLRERRTQMAGKCPEGAGADLLAPRRHGNTAQQDGASALLQLGLQS